MTLTGPCWAGLAARKRTFTGTSDFDRTQTRPSGAEFFLKADIAPQDAQRPLLGCPSQLQSLIRARLIFCSLILRTTVGKAMSDGKLVLTGDRQVASRMQTWLGLSPFAAEKKLVSA
jgi:hypothetical protein